MCVIILLIRCLSSYLIFYGRLKNIKLRIQSNQNLNFCCRLADTFPSKTDSVNKRKPKGEINPKSYSTFFPHTDFQCSVICDVFCCFLFYCQLLNVFYHICTMQIDLLTLQCSFFVFRWS